MADPTVVECRSFGEPSDKLFMSAVTQTDAGPRVAVAMSRDSISIYASGGAGLEQQHQVVLPEDGEAIVAVPNGWLVLPSMRFLDAAGTLGPPHRLTGFPPESGGKRKVSHLVGATLDAGHVLIAWNEVLKDKAGHVHPPDVHGAIVDASGAIISPRFLIRAESANAVGPVVTSDGTSFFVVTLDMLTRLDSVGRVLGTTTGFPGTPPNPIAVTYFAGWQGTTGWDIALGEHRTYVLQRFDATGAKVGALTQIALPTTPMVSYLSGFSVDGDHLVAIAWADRMQQMVADVFSVEISATGEVSIPIALGVGTLDYRGKAERLGPDLLAGWLAGTHAQLARLAP